MSFNINSTVRDTLEEGPAQPVSLSDNPSGLADCAGKMCGFKFHENWLVLFLLPPQNYWLIFLPQIPPAKVLIGSYGARMGIFVR